MNASSDSDEANERRKRFGFSEVKNNLEVLSVIEKLKKPIESNLSTSHASGMNRLNKYTIVPVEEEVLNGSSNEENEEDMININGLKPLHDFFSSSVDPKPAGENKRDIWQEIEYLAASNKQAVKNEESAKDGVSQNPDSSNFIFPFLNSENTRNSEFKRDYFSFDDDDFNLLVPDNSTFPSIDSSSSDDDDGGRFFYRPGRLVFFLDNNALRQIMITMITNYDVVMV